MTKGIVISLYDFTGEALKPWAKAGNTCYAFDIQHKGWTIQGFGKDCSGSIHYRKADLHDRNTLNAIHSEFADRPMVFGMAFPVCTDMAVWCRELFEDLGVPYFVKNPVREIA